MTTNGHNGNGNGHRTNGHNGNSNGHRRNGNAGRGSRWDGIKRTYDLSEVEKLRPSLKMEYTLARHGAERLWELLNTEDYVNTFGALTGAQAVQMVKGGLKAIYLSGWQVAADANISGQTYPDQSLYPANSVPQVVKRLKDGRRIEHRLVRTHRRRCGSRLWWSAACLRANEVNDRSGCGRCPL
jgi:isocitrate lyase